MARILDHIDLRVRRLANVQAFYEALLPALGFTRDASIEGWFQFEADSGAVTEFFGITESPNHVPNETRIAFWAESIHEVDRLTAIITTAGARHIEGPAFETPSYYAVFFEDPCGNRLEICHRTSSATES
ncbi:MAG TPA: VOC family protein [Chthoniobacteraceae bacterium]|nr:VOC family protein [Chthoniobacteraceae bacterium]